VQSGHPVIKASKVTKRMNLQVAANQAASSGNGGASAAQKMNIKQQF